jgi:hypothetical protein
MTRWHGTGVAALEEALGAQARQSALFAVTEQLFGRRA